MSINMDYATQENAESRSFFSYPIDDSGDQSCPAAFASESALDVPSATRKVWHEFLAQHNVAAAILSVVLAGSPPKRHAFLIGFDPVRNDPGVTRQLLHFSEKLWSRMGDRTAVPFQNEDCRWRNDPARHDAGPVSALLAGYEHGVAAQQRHNATCVQAIYLRKYGLDRFNANELASLQLILPLLADSAARGAQLAEQALRSNRLEAMFDRVSLSMMMLSAESQPIFMNSAARASLQERKWLIRSADGSISCTNPKQARKLRDSIRIAAAAEPDAPIENVYRLDDGNGEWRLAYVLSATSRSGAAAARCALLFILAPGRMDAPSQLLEALGLLPSEQRFLGHFLKASSLCDAATDCGLSEETARTYLKRVRAKLGVHRQMELAGLISGLVLPLHGTTEPTTGE